jgi:peptide deformylase
MELVTYPHPILKTKLPFIQSVTNDHKKIAEQMAKIMYANNGVGLAANQVNYPFQMFVMGYDRVFINPVILMRKGVQRGSEGCLSMPGLRQSKVRFSSVKLRYVNLDGKTVTERFTDLEARIVQHEVDHLNGILCLDPTKLAAA